ncbi:hypothetical protein D3P07_13960 [Paenibacillus sp. 1011MAR3C5]|uniref:DUF6809 family protein n=1 Tax=Paenibacillus sp. 1011MAR3C5 TaxID=1675787 RepID=UPI000E6B8315|nr:DUF6809 family protein [Paenibacillus sp. 1011MAR3C5]RJE87442.1 hypothetical protein D3P07_13960 [Paenibacillus sp. 1011MAR3C5]
MNIIENLYEGNIDPVASIVPRNPEYRVLIQKISDDLLKWKKKLSEDEFAELERLLDLRRELEILQSRESFIQGFKIAGQMMVEVLNEKD